MPAPTITPLPTPPSRRRPSAFSDEADAWNGAIPQFSTEMDAVGQYVETKAGEVEQNATNVSNTAINVSNDAQTASEGALLSQQWATSTVEVDGGFKGARGYAEDAEAAVAALPEGTINDVIIATDSAWSSQKINSELALKASTSALASKRDITNQNFSNYSLAKGTLSATQNTSINVAGPRNLKQSIGGNRDYSLTGTPGTAAFTITLYIYSSTPLSDRTFTWPAGATWLGDGTAPEFSGTTALVFFYWTGDEWLLSSRE